MLMSSRKAVPLLVVALAACSTSTEPVRPLAGSTAAMNNGNGVEIAVNGQGVADLSAFNLPPLEFHFVAKQQGDGTAHGHFRFFRDSPSGTHDFEATVTCVSVDPNFPGRARIGGIVTANNSTAASALTTNHEVGDDVWFRIQDDAGDGTFESTTVLGFAPILVNTSAEYCALPFSGTVNGQNVWSTQIFALLKGQLRVKAD